MTVETTNSADFNHQLAEKQIAKEKAQTAAGPIRGATDERGKVNVYLINEKKWKKLWPIDAMDMMRAGAANLEGPEPEQVKVEVVDYSKYKVAELKAFGQLANIEGSDNMTKEKLIEALAAAKYVPDKTE